MARTNRKSGKGRESSASKSDQRSSPVAEEKAKSWRDHPNVAIANLMFDRPKGSVIVSLVATTMFGFFFGLLIGICVALVTSVVANKAWIYSANIGIALLTKLVFQWLWILVLKPALAIPIAKALVQRSGQSFSPEQYQAMSASALLGNLTVIATVATALATISATGDLVPRPVNDFVVIACVSALAGAVAALAEFLSTESNVQALVRNGRPVH